MVASILDRTFPAGEVASVYDPSAPLTSVVSIVAAWLPLALWCAWWLWCADWSKLWPTLAAGAWAPAVLFVLVGGAVWGRLDPNGFGAPGYVVAAHVAAAAGLACVAMFCGWLQGVFGWTPPEFPVHPAPAAHGHDHGHGHGHH
jgi:hypothetical protein